MNTTHGRIILRDWLHATLTAAQAERDQRQNMVDGELGWIRHERTVMHDAVNKARAERGLPPVPLAAVERVEQQAAGHSDYTSKFALYCAELVLQEQP